MRSWRRIGEPKVVFDGWRKVIRKTFVTSDGREMDAEVFDQGGDAVAVIALTKDNEVIIARQFRCGPEEVFDELPGGGVDANEDPATAAMRELEEETGYIGGSIEHLGKIYKHGWMSTIWNYYIAYNCVPGKSGQRTEEFEEIEVDLITIEQLFQNARSAKMSDTEAVFLAYETLKSLEGTNETTN